MMKEELLEEEMCKHPKENIYIYLEREG